MPHPRLRRALKPSPGFQTDSARRASSIAIAINVLFALSALLFSSLVLLSLGKHHSVVDIIEKKLDTWHELEKLVNINLHKAIDKKSLNRIVEKYQSKISGQLATLDELNRKLEVALQQNTWWHFSVKLGLSAPPPALHEVSVADVITSNVRNITRFSIDYASNDLESWNSIEQINFLSGAYIKHLSEYVRESEKYIGRTDNIIITAFALTGALMVLTSVLTRSILLSPALDALDKKHLREIEIARELKDSELLTSQAFKALPSPALVCDTEGNFKYHNSAFSSEILNSFQIEKNNLFSLLHVWQLRHGWAEGEKMRNVVDIKSAIDRHPLVNANGNLLKIRCQMTHTQELLLLITDETALTEVRNAENHRKGLEALGRFSSGVAHDFNNILATILTKVEYIMLVDQSSQDLNKHLNDLVVSCDRGRTLVSRIVAFTRPQTPRLSAVSTAELTEIIQSQLNNSQSSIKISIRSDTRYGVLLDPLMITTVLENLVKNSNESIGESNPGSVYIDFTEDKLTEEQIEFVIRVRDTGAGFSENDLHNALEPFYSNKSLEAGVGLGLSMAVQMVEINGGTVRLSNWEHGAQVSLVFPAIDIIRSQNEPGTGSRPSLSLINEGQSRPSGNCVLLEDNQALMTSQKLILARRFKNVIAGSSNSEILEALSDLQDIEAAILDWNLPDGTSEQTINCIMVQFPACRILVLSGNISQKLQYFCDEQNIGILRKPVSMSRVIEYLSNAKPPGSGHQTAI